MSKTILYIGGFELPDKNAAAQRVIGIAKGLRELGHTVVFLNSVKSYEAEGIKEVEYFGFRCYEYKRENEADYLFTGHTALSMIKQVDADAIIAYNYPAVSLNRIRIYCKNNHKKCFADATEWYQAVGENIVYRIIKNLDTAYRMRWVQKRLDGVIAISRFLYDYYKDSVKTILIPPTVDLSDKKWNVPVEKNTDVVSFVYAGVPIALKEKLDVIVKAFSEVEKSNNSVRLNIVGVTEEQFKELYGWNDVISESIFFWGRIEHLQVIKLVKGSDWAIILRDNNRVVKAGFPTKLVESISCGTPVIVNRFSNIEDYISDRNSIITDLENITQSLRKAILTKNTIDRSLFDYNRYLEELMKLI